MDHEPAGDGGRLTSYFTAVRFRDGLPNFENVKEIMESISKDGWSHRLAVNQVLKRQGVQFDLLSTKHPIV